MEGSALRQLKWRLAHRRYLQDERASVRKARIVIANSETTKRDLIEHLGIPSDRIHTVYLGIDPEQFRPPSEQAKAALRAGFGWPVDRPVVVFVGGLGDRRKGFDTLFTAWQRLCSHPAWDCDLMVVGRGPELKDWTRRAAPLGARIRFLGFRKDVPQILAAADTLVAPTRYESYGLSVQEALCCGLPAFVSRAAGVAERYPGNLQDLLISNPDDADELAAKLTAWRECRQAYRTAVSGLSGSLRSYTWRVMSERMMNLMEGAN